MKKTFVTIALCVAIVASGVGIAYVARAIRSPEVLAAVPQNRRLSNVAVRVLKTGPVNDIVILTGSAEAWETVTLSSETTGKIEWLSVEAGDVVKKGDELVRINTTGIRARLAHARAQFKLAQQELARIQRLRKGGVSSPQELDRALLNKEAALSSLRLNEIVLAQSSITAPIDGVADEVYKKVGEFAGVGTTLLRIVQVRRIKIILGMPERNVPHFDSGNPVRITIDAFPGKTFEGHIHRIATTADAETRTFATEVEVDNADGLLKPGMIARAVLIKKSYLEAITVPLFSVMSDGAERYVFVESESTAHRRPIEAGFFRGDFIYVAQGLKAGDRLIVTGQRELTDGQGVKVRKVIE